MSFFASLDYTTGAHSGKALSRHKILFHGRLACVPLLSWATAKQKSCSRQTVCISAFAKNGERSVLYGRI